MKYAVTPPYPIIRQLPACCVPASLSMILQRHGLLQWSQEEIGEQLGLVTPAVSPWFYRDHSVDLNVREAPKSGWGTRINIPAYSIDAFFERHRLPLRFAYDLHIDRDALIRGIERGDDQLLCVESFLYPGNGHVVLLSAIDDAYVAFIDPNTGIEQRPFSQLHARSPENMGGTWRISRTSP